MLDNIRVEDILFLDIETVPAVQSFELLEPRMTGISGRKNPNSSGLPIRLPDEVYERAGIYSEFGKIICISVGLDQGKESFQSEA